MPKCATERKQISKKSTNQRSKLNPSHTHKRKPDTKANVKPRSKTTVKLEIKHKAKPRTKSTVRPDPMEEHTQCLTNQPVHQPVHQPMQQTKQPKRNNKHGPKKQTPKAHTIKRDVIETYIKHKAFDLISDGQYKKLVIRCKENGDQWAMQAYSNVQETTNMIKSVVHEVNTLHEFGKNRLQNVCQEVMSCVNPPCRRRMGWNVCNITGTRSDECIDLTRPGKSESIVAVHPKFTHFLTMLWIVTKFEHICKVFTRNWLSQKDAEYQETTFIQKMCQDFECKKDEIGALYNAFTHAHSHVTESIRLHKTSMDMNLLRHIKQKE